jgi:large subunit ribosomal protein L7/L12|uniref:Large ribosomal subunit protein bL12 n=1 Tax=candidate division CPR3 bacterium TaxID=2268181 RepID=A0A7C5YUD0_UNCC3
MAEKKQKEAKKTKKETSTEKEEKKTYSEKTEKLLEVLETMTPLEIAETVKALEEKYGITAAAPVAVAATPTAQTQETQQATEEKSTFDVELTAAGENKIAVIKALKEIKPELGLKEAKDIVDGAPKVIMEGVKKEVAEEAKKKLEAVGAKVTLK